MSLFESDVAYCETALHCLREKDGALRFETDVTGSVLTLDASDDLRPRFGYFSAAGRRSEGPRVGRRAAARFRESHQREADREMKALEKL